MHIDPLATAIVAGIAIVGMAAVLWPARKPKPDPKPELGEPWNHARVAKPTEEELRSRGIDPEAFFKGALTKPVYPGPASEVIELNPTYDSVMHKLEMRSASLNPDGSISISGFMDVADGREPMALGEETVIALDRYFVDDFAEVDGFHVEDRATGLTCAPSYTHRKSALRAARRLNAKAELAASNGRLA